MTSRKSAAYNVNILSVDQTFSYSFFSLFQVSKTDLIENHLLIPLKEQGREITLNPNQTKSNQTNAKTFYLFLIANN